MTRSGTDPVMADAPTTSTVSRERIAELFQRETEEFERANPRSRELHERAVRGPLLSGVPMNWMTRWPGPFPIYVSEAHGATVVDVDGHSYADLCLGDTGAMTGHSPPATVAAAAERLGNGITTMLPSEDSLEVGEQMQQRFGLRHWQFTLSATDANRFAIRVCRQVTERPKILVHNRCYHGSVDETFATLEGGSVTASVGNIGPPVELERTTRVVEFNDAEGLVRELEHEDVACVLAEPALTNVGIVLPEPGYHDALREITRDTGTLLIIDETHTLCCGPGGFTAAEGLDPDLLTIGKPIAGGIPTGAYGMSDAVAAAILERTLWEVADTGGIGGTLAGNALSLTAVRATLGEVLTEEAFDRMIALGERFESAVAAAIAEHELPWQVTRLGCRAEYMFAPSAPAPAPRRPPSSTPSSTR